MFIDTVMKSQICESNKGQEMFWIKWDYLFQFANKFSKYLLKTVRDKLHIPVVFHLVHLS